MKHSILILLVLCFFQTEAYAQTGDPVEGDLQELEAKLNTQRYTVNPLFSAILVGKNKWEINQFNSLQSFKWERRQMGENIFTGEPENTCISCFRFSSFDQGLQVQYGLSQNYQFNLGFDLYARSTRLDTSLSSSAFDVFSSGNNVNTVTRGLSAFGPRIRWMPFRTLPEFTVNSALIFGLGDEEQKAAFFRARTEWQTNLVFFQSFAQRFSVVLQPSSRIFFASNSEDSTFYFFGGNVTLSAYLTGLTQGDYPKLSLFANLYHQQDFNSSSEEGWKNTGDVTQGGLGLMAQFNPQFLLYLVGQTTLSENTDVFNRRFFDTVDRNNWNVLSLGIRLYLPRP